MSIYSWGRNGNGELGTSASDSKDMWAPEAVEMAQTVHSIAAGDGHTLFSTESGDVYSCGRGRQGQLGHPSRDNKFSPTLVADLSHESIIRVAASGVSSYAITATGRVYHWGLVHRPNHQSPSQMAPLEKSDETTNDSNGKNDNERAYEQVTAGQLTGLAENQEDILVHVDTEARAHTQSYTQRSEPQYASRQLKDIVTDSTERWMLANDDADAEYYRELQAMGYDKEELDEKMQDRGKEYHGMLRIQCKRAILPSPEVILSLSHVKVVSLAAGFAHCIALTDQGIMYSCGYNDRGQLGLGHRISSSDFKPVDFMQGKVVLQVECGQQHSMCRALDRVGRGGGKEPSLSSVDDMNGKIGASVFVWGNGMLGQLGLGLKGTSKGRLLPTLLTTLCDVAPLGAIDISAGGNFSVAVALDGRVFSWGHAEYNQHGSTMVGGNDYVDNHFYFVPRPVSVVDRSGNQVKLVQVSCGSNFTVAVTDEGDVYSWGWHAYGVLGHGRGFFGQSAMKISSLGQAQIDRSVVRVCTGSNHVVAITASSGNAWAKTFQEHMIPSYMYSCDHSSLATLPLPSPYDVENFSDVEIIDEASGTVFPCHMVILAARSPYLAGFLRAASISRGGTCGRDKKSDKVQVFLETSAATPTTIHFLLQYLYTDTLSAPAHKRKQLAELADFLVVHRLASLCRHHGAYTDRMIGDGCDSNSIPPSTFEQDLLTMAQSDMFTDCKFVVHTMPSERELEDEHGGGAVEHEPEVISGHKLLYSKMPYFRSLFSVDFSDGYIDSSGILNYDLAGFLLDGINVKTFRRLVAYAYSGSPAVLEVEDSEALMDLLVASNRVGLLQLTQLCERKLSLHLNDYPENIENCLAFAQMYNIPRLARQCGEMLASPSCRGGHV